MDDDTINILTSRAFEALTAASEAAMDALRRDLTPEDRAVRAGLARDPVCGETHATILGDHVDERTGGWASARTAQATAHFRLAIAATSAGPFRLHGGRA